MVDVARDELRPIFERLIKPPEDDEEKDQDKEDLRQKVKGAINLDDIIKAMMDKSKGKKEQGKEAPPEE